MELIRADDIQSFINPGVVSRQILNADNSSSERVTITEVHLEEGASQTRHMHEASEQVWYAIKGSGKLLLEANTEREFRAGDVVRFTEKEIHGLFNDGVGEFVYISVTSPPIHFGYAYQDKR